MTITNETTKIFSPSSLSLVTAPTNRRVLSYHRRHPIQIIEAFGNCKNEVVNRLVNNR